MSHSTAFFRIQPPQIKSNMFNYWNDVAGGFLLTQENKSFMSTSIGITLGAAGGGAMGGFLIGADYGVVLGAVIGASVSVIASKDNNRRKIFHFILALGAGILIAKEASEFIAQVWSWEISPKITAIIISALLIPVLVLAANKDNLRKLFSRIAASIDRNFSSIVQAIKDWRNKGGN